MITERDAQKYESRFHMSANATLIRIFALLLGAGALNLGLGLQATLLGVRAGIEGFSTNAIGFVMSAYYVGFIAGTFLSPKLINRVGHIRTFSALASLASAVALCYILFVDPISWMVFRAITGICFAGLAMATESWLNEKSTNINRGTVLSVYMVVILSATAGGQMLLNLAEPGGHLLFVLVSIVISVALVPVALTTSAMPVQIHTTRMSLGRLFGRTPVGVIGCIGAGVVIGSFWSLGAVYAHAIGLSTLKISIFMTLVIGGGVISQFPLGRLSDHHDRRYIIFGLSVCIAVVGFLIAVLNLGLVGLFVLASLYGAMILPLYGLAIAHANDLMEPEEFVPASAALLLLYGIGAATGPILAAVAMSHAGPGGLFLSSATVAVILAAFVAFRIRKKSILPTQTQSDFVPAPRTTSVIYEMDPRSESDDEAPEGTPEVTPP
ncbi:MFS transporter [Varunaivibrio sulfuroxidans]|uniref:Putative MFS family arabinose efflux permease n=1 Tax=Varunaivibrio sulfuroxidans TaxID=1773489 RepID=A0A4R3JBG4_9PROT|nr:MFS transporter [Varunaivibrio sulfuroxidans]TCS62635.1 putative MFS family arabinose efflux permease [Varunaivibrio sulfuroxidans]WES30698.1 MFS transporter [Varunaivibrio sulfuroxidans]